MSRINNFFYDGYYYIVRNSPLTVWDNSHYYLRDKPINGSYTRTPQLVSWSRGIRVTYIDSMDPEQWYSVSSGLSQFSPFTVGRSPRYNLTPGSFEMDPNKHPLKTAHALGGQSHSYKPIVDLRAWSYRKTSHVQGPWSGSALDRPAVTDPDHQGCIWEDPRLPVYIHYFVGTQYQTVILRVGEYYGSLRVV